jgi:hypothetical protein
MLPKSSDSTLTIVANGRYYFWTVRSASYVSKKLLWLTDRVQTDMFSHTHNVWTVCKHCEMISTSSLFGVVHRIRIGLSNGSRPWCIDIDLFAFRLMEVRSGRFRREQTVSTYSEPQITNGNRWRPASKTYDRGRSVPPRSTLCIAYAERSIVILLTSFSVSPCHVMDNYSPVSASVKSLNHVVCYKCLVIYTSTRIVGRCR